MHGCASCAQDFSVPGPGFWPLPGQNDGMCIISELIHSTDGLLVSIRPTPKRLQGRAKRTLHEIMYAETRAQAERGIEAFVAEFSPKYEKAVDCLIKDREALLAFFDCPAEHWKHLRTSNPSSRASRPCGSASA
jgi:Transposase, Mutator family